MRRHEKILAFIQARHSDVLGKLLEHCGPWTHLLLEKTTRTGLFR